MARTVGDRVELAQYRSLSGVPGLVHGVSLRHGGVSPAPFASLNVSFSVGDAPENTRENRRRLAGSLGLTGQEIVCAGLVHGNHVTVVGRADRGRGFQTPASIVPESDGLVTADSGVVLWMTYADCVPILLCDPVRRVAGLAHAGWRGTLLRVPAATVAAMRSVFGSDPANIRAVIGPSIGPCCYEVGPEVREAFEQEWPAEAGLPGELFGAGKGQRPHLDLWEANRRALLAAGLPPQQIELDGRCTPDNVGDFFSHRGERGRTGRFAAAIGFGK